MELSVILPCRNEAAHVVGCLDSVVASVREGPWARDRAEVFVLDGGSTDGTRALAERYAARLDWVHVVDNPGRTAPAAMNLGLAHAKGRVIVRMDVHVRYPKDYLRRLVDRLATSGADNVGGRVETLPGADTVTARAIARALGHPFGVGNSAFRLAPGTDAAPRWVDTVPFGCFRRELALRLGGFDEELVRNQDDEFNGRLIRNGGRILLDPSIVVQYFGRARYGQLARMYYQYGLFKPLAARKLGAVTTVRQLVPAAFLVALAGLAGLGIAFAPARLALLALALTYAGAALLVAARATRPEGVRAAFALAFAFAVLHLSYGWGYLRGLVGLAHRRGAQAAATHLPLSR